MYKRVCFDNFSLFSLTIIPLLTSSFQTLPRLVIDNVLDKFPDNVRKWHSISPLLWTCQGWRAACLYSLCKACKLRITKDSVEKNWLGWPEGWSQIIPYPMSQSRTLHVSMAFPMSDAAIGSQLQKSRAEVLENVRNLNLHLLFILDESGSDFNLQNAETNVFLFLEYLTVAVPNVVNVTIVNNNFAKRQPSNTLVDLLGQMERAVIRMAKRQLFFSIDSVFGAIDIGLLNADCNSLTCIKFMGKTNICNYELVRRCAKTLQKLHIIDNPVYGVFTELFMDNNQHVVYPRLVSLTADLRKEMSPNPKPPNFPVSYAPFPRLQIVNLRDIWQLGGSIVFRGNQSTLRFLKLTISQGVVDLLGRTLVFTATSHPNLQQVVLKESREILSSVLPAGFLEQVSNMLRHARSVDMTGEVYTGEWLKSLRSYQDVLDSVRYLNIRDHSMTFTDALQLLKKFPNLLCLECIAIRKDMDLEAMQEMTSTQQPLNRSWKALSISGAWNGTMIPGPVALIALVILCPNLEKLKFPKDHLVYYFELEWDELLARDEYQEHASRIKSIVDMSTIYYFS